MGWSGKPLSRPLDGGRLGLLGGNEVQTLVKFVGLTQGAFSKLPCDSPGEEGSSLDISFPEGMDTSAGCRRAEPPPTFNGSEQIMWEAHSVAATVR